MAQELKPTGLIVTGLNVIGHEQIWQTNSVDSFDLSLEGIPDDRHYGLTRIIQKYESKQLSGLSVLNDKQISIVSESDMITISENMNLPVDDIEARSGLPIVQFLAQQLAANILVNGNDLRSAAGHGVLFAFGVDRDDVNAVLRVTEYNEPCRKPSAKMFNSLGNLGISAGCGFDEFKDHFKQSAADRRGWVASVYRTGKIAVGDSIFSHSPVQLPII